MTRLILHFLTAVLVLSWHPAGAAEARSCTIDDLEGEGARYWRAGIWNPIAVGDQIAPEDKVETGPDARVRIVCSDGIVVTVGTGTVVNLEELVGPAGPRRNVVLQLIDGITGIIAPRRNWNRFDVRTNVAIASVRSTEWLTEAARAGDTAVFVRRGVVDVRTAARRDRLRAGDGITITADGAVGPVKVWGAARIAKSVERLGFDWR